jgi:formylglycine-generating enzyme required for sulfatase activity
VDETRSADRPAPAPEDTPARRTRNTGAVATDLAPGECREYPEVPGYEVLGILGHGGMGVVYRARQLKANRLVALKMLRALEHATPQDRLRFQIETEAVARLQHPHIVQLYEAGEVRGQPFFSLEFCDGGRLSDQLTKRRPSPREAAALIETLARAMHYAHLRGVVHRDLKPGNVLLAGAERLPKITDFGLAKRIDAEAREVSRSGAIMGTASYMAPEQAAGKVHDTGPAADVYALGALLYECLTGRPPFEGPQHVVLMSVLSDEPVPPSRLGAKVPRDLETICLKCLRKEPARRYASAEELADDLRRFQVGEPIRARQVGAVERAVKWVRRHAAVAALAAAVLLVTVLGMAGIVWKYFDAEKQKQEAQRAAAKAERASDYLASIFELADASGQRGTVSARQILDDAEKSIPQQFADQPELRDQLLEKIGAVYDKMTAAAPLAMILEVRGTVQLQSTRDPNQRALPQSLLYTGDRLSLGTDGRVQVVILSDLHKEWLRPATEATVRRKGCEPADAVAERNDDLLMTFVRLPKGTFYMGWDGQHKGVKTEIPEDFEIALHDVTQGQWQAVMGGENPSYFARFGGGRNEVKTLSDEELKLLPVETVSWDDAQEFIRRLNEREHGRGYLYRLPTEAEWEYACRGGATSEEECSHYFYLDKPTDDLSSEQANFNGNFPFGKAPKGKYLGHTTRVGAYPSNRLGLCDVHGNVWQWCADDYWQKKRAVLAARMVGVLGGPFGQDPFLAASILSPQDGANGLVVGGSDRVIRGGGWINGGTYCRAADRFRYAPSYRSLYLGFRLARAPRGPRTCHRTEPAALPFRQGLGPGGQMDGGPPGVSSVRERSGWPFLHALPRGPQTAGHTGQHG